MTRASIRPTSPHGYWIRPDGSLMAMEAPQDHGAWLIRNQVFPDHNFALAIDATEHAVAAGWIGITISPLHGNSVGRNVLQVTAMVTACLAKITPVAAHLATRTKELCPLFLGPSAPTAILEPGLLPPAATNFPTLEEELVALHMTSRVLVRAQAAVGLHGLRQRHPAFDAVYRELTAMAHWAGHLRHNLERMRAALIHPEATGETISDAARFFLDHECGRTFHVIAERSIPDLLTVKLPALRRELAAAAEENVSTP